MVPGQAIVVVSCTSCPGPLCAGIAQKGGTNIEPIESRGDLHNSEARAKAVTEDEQNDRGSVTQEEFQTWLNSFRDRYAGALEYLRDH